MATRIARRWIVSVVLFLGVTLFGFGLRDGVSQKLITYQTEDGWTIYGDLYLPEMTSQAQVPAVVLMSEPHWTIRRIYGGLGEKISKRGMVALAIDLRGSGLSEGKRKFFTFTPEEQQKVQLDVQGAIKFLSAQKGVDKDRIALVGAGISAHYAALEAAGNPAVQALGFLSGLLRPASLDFVKARRDIPIFIAVDPKDKESFKDMAEANYLSENEDTEFVVGVDHGPVAFWHVGGLEDRVADWFVEHVKGLGIQSEISFKSEDGLSVHGRLWMPDAAKDGAKVPGVVLVHGAMHDQSTYYHLARAITKKGMAALTFEWRGGQRYLPEQLAGHDSGSAYLDVKAAIKFLVSQSGVDADRIGMVGATAGNGHMVEAARTDPRVKALVMLSAYNLSDLGTEYIKGNNVPVLVFASTEDVNYGVASLAEVSQRTYRSSGSKGSQFLLFDHAGRGSEMLKTRPELQTMIVRWFMEKLMQEDVLFTPGHSIPKGL